MGDREWTVNSSHLVGLLVTTKMPLGLRDFDGLTVGLKVGLAVEGLRVGTGVFFSAFGLFVATGAALLLLQVGSGVRQMCAFGT